jgi:hypothetical protein
MLLNLNGSLLPFSNAVPVVKLVHNSMPLVNMEGLQHFYQHSCSLIHDSNGLRHSEGTLHPLPG